MNKITRAQLAYDNLLPRHDTAFLETEAGEHWLKSCANLLVHGYPVEWSSRTQKGKIERLPLEDIEMKVLDISSDDRSHRLGEMIRCVASCDLEGARAALDSLFCMTGTTASDYMQELAEDTLRQHAEAYAKAERENAEDARYDI